jgi:hypothetical protein
MRRVVPQSSSSSVVVLLEADSFYKFEFLNKKSQTPKQADIVLLGNSYESALYFAKECRVAEVKIGSVRQQRQLPRPKQALNV